jgi:hypothetical protein
MVLMIQDIKGLCITISLVVKAGYYQGLAVNDGGMQAGIKSIKEN